MTRPRLASTLRAGLIVLCAELIVLGAAPLHAGADGLKPVEVAAGVRKRRAAFAAASSANSTAPTMVQLYEDPVTGQLFTRPGAGRRLLAVPATVMGAPPVAPSELDSRIEQKAAAAAEREVEKFKTEQGATNAALASQLQQMQPAWREFGDRWFKKIKLGATVYADYSLYTHTGFGPQLLTQTNPPGPGNNLFNSFDITRTYLNFFFSPTDDFTLRVTPNIYRTLDSNTNFRVGRTGALSSNLSQQPGVRIKYAYLDWNTPFRWSRALKEDKITFGQQQNALVDWEEGLYGFRYVNLVPWNWAGLSSTQIGVALKGPIKFNELQYVDYELGIYNNTAFGGNEKSNTKEGMVRVTLNPLGAKSRFDNLGLTGFYNYGYSNQTPDVTAGGSKSANIRRLAALVHYTAASWGLIGEYDWGHNAYGVSNMFSGAGPSDAFGIASPSVGGTPIFKNLSDLATALQGNNRSTQQGFAFMGHADIPRTPFTLFGTFSQWLANTKVDRNPFDLQRFIVGVEWKYNKYLRFALDSQNLTYYHGQFTFSNAELAKFSSSIAAAHPGGISNAVPRDTHAFFLNVEFNY